MKDYLHFYIGQFGELKRSSGGDIYEYYESGRWILTGSLYHEIMCCDHEFILELRPLSDMSEQEAIEWSRTEAEDQMTWDAARTTYLLSKGFDLFGLKEKGLADL